MYSFDLSAISMVLLMIDYMNYTIKPQIYLSDTEIWISNSYIDR